MKSSHKLSNQEEHPGFFRGALAWRGSVTPRILPGVIVTTCYTLILALVDQYLYKLPHPDVTPFEYTGAVLGLVLVFRTNAGYDRWWEARKLWGGITNQSRNLLVMTWSYGPNDDFWRQAMSKWISVYPFAVKESLRQQKHFDDLNNLLSEDELAALKNAQHMPLFVVSKIAGLLEQVRAKQMIDPLVFAEFERQRSLLVDYLGGCERILKTPMPLVYAIKIRRFILIYLLLLPFSLIGSVGYVSAFIAFLVAYPLLSLDRIGLELQNPFSERNLSHLPLQAICETIRGNGLGLTQGIR